jgi:regulator of sigma E protease
MSFLPTLLTFLVVLSLLVFAHELGHFVTAKRAGIKVQEFGLGLPPRLFGIRYGETLYSLNLLPLGGFVKMLGENAAPDDPRTFSSKSKRVRATVLIAGSAMNLLLAPLLFSAAFMVGEPVADRVIVKAVEFASPAAVGGMQAGDVVVSVGDQPIVEVGTLRSAVKAASGNEVEIVVRRNNQMVPLRLAARQGAQEDQGPIGIQLQQEFRTRRYSPSDAIPLSVRRTGELLIALLDGLRQMIIGAAPAELTGPVGIAATTGRAAQAGPQYLLYFAGFLSLNLALFNMLPFPGLDGARFAFVLLEGIRRGRRLSPRLEGTIHLTGIFMLMSLMLYVSVHDVRRLVQG